MKNRIQDIMRAIARDLDKEKGRKVEEATYNDQRTLINSLFKNGAYNQGQILLRLTVIDSLYSTNAAYSYFSLEEMAEKIAALGSEADARKYFNQVLCTGKDDKKLFSEPYGIRKNISDGSQQMSLLSKYAYYAMLQDTKTYPLGFPIYDSLAKEAYPTVCKMLGISKSERISLPSMDTPTVSKYIQALRQLKERLFDNDNLFEGYQQYDILDAYLWRMGKFEHGNLSLLLSRNDYVKFVENLKLQADAKDKNDTDYKERMIKEHKNTPAVTYKNGKGSFDFGEAVVFLCADNKRHPFKGLSEEAYLNQLLDHWRVFHAEAKKK